MAVNGHYEHLELEYVENTAQEKDLQPLQSDIRRYRQIGVSFGFLCAVLALLNIVLLVYLYQSNIKERDQLLNNDSPRWQKFGGSYYYISTGKTTFDNSRQWCRDRQSDLIVINSKEEQDFVDNLYQIVWLGLTDRDKGQYKWVDGKPLTTPTYWRPDQPDNRWSATHGTQDCVVFDNEAKTRGWTDVYCSNSYHWICERDVC